MYRAEHQHVINQWQKNTKLWQHVAKYCRTLQNVAKLKQMTAYKHFGFWHCMDTLRDKENLEKYLRLKNAR